MQRARLSNDEVGDEGGDVSCADCCVMDDPESRRGSEALQAAEVKAKAAMAEPDVIDPSEWEQHLNPATGQKYWRNRRTGKTRSTMPTQ